MAIINIVFCIGVCSVHLRRRRHGHFKLPELGSITSSRRCNTLDAIETD